MATSTSDNARALEARQPESFSMAFTAKLMNLVFGNPLELILQQTDQRAAKLPRKKVKSPEGERNDQKEAGKDHHDIDAHDIALDRDARPIFVNTLFSCLAAPSETHSFRPVWQPP